MKREGFTRIKLLTVIVVLAIISIMPRTIMNEKHEVLESSISVYTKEEVDNLLATLRNSITTNTNEITNIKNEISTLNSSLTNYALKSEINTTNSYIDDLNTIIANNTSRIEALENNGNVNEQEVVNKLTDALKYSGLGVTNANTLDDIAEKLQNYFYDSFNIMENSTFVNGYSASISYARPDFSIPTYSNGYSCSTWGNGAYAGSGSMVIKPNVTVHASKVRMHVVINVGASNGSGSTTITVGNQSKTYGIANVSEWIEFDVSDVDSFTIAMSSSVSGTHVYFSKVVITDITVYGA